MNQLPTTLLPCRLVIFKLSKGQFTQITRKHISFHRECTHYSGLSTDADSEGSEGLFFPFVHSEVCGLSRVTRTLLVDHKQNFIHFHGIGVEAESLENLGK